MAYVITDACIDIMDRSCMEQCPVDCIQEGDRMLYINPDDCIDCAACEPTCPQEAIYLADRLPDSLKQYEQVNAEFFEREDLGPAGSNGRESAVDHPVVAISEQRSR